MTVRELSIILRDHDCRAFCVQFFEGKWRASVRRPSAPFFVIVDADSMIDSIEGLVSKLGPNMVIA